MDYKNLIEDIAEWIRSHVLASGTEGVVLGLSGGIDSSVVVGLAVRAVGENVTGIIMPCQSSPEDAADAQEAASVFGAQTLNVPLDRAYTSMIDVLPRGGEMADANMKARLRMAALYHAANSRRCLVAGTGNRSELAVGYFTKYGDGGADILPLGGLLKTEVKQLARVLGVPGSIVEKPPSAGLWKGQTDEEEMGVDYSTLDEILQAWESGRRPNASPKTVEKVRAMVDSSSHKRQPPPIFQP